MKNTVKTIVKFAPTLLIFAVILVIQTITVDAQSDAAVSAAEAQIDKDQTAQAIAALNTVIASEPKNAAAYAQRARAYFIAKKSDLALPDAEKALSLDAKNAVAHNIRGLIKREHKDYDGAIADFTQAIETDPKFVKAIYNRADIYAAQKKFDLAIENLSQVVKIMPGNPNAYILRAKIYETQGKTDPAIADYTSSIKLKPNDLILLGSRGNLYLNIYKFDAAIADYRQALTVEPQNAGIKENLAMALARQKYLKPGVKIDDAATAAAMKTAFNAYNQKDYQAAVKSYTDCISNNPVADACYAGRADAERKLEKYDAAIADYNIAAELNATGAKIFSNRGLTYFRQKNYEAAIKDYNRAIELDPKDAASYQNRGASFANLDKLTEGEADVKKALELNPNDQSIKDTLDQIEAELHPAQQRIIYGGASTEPLSSAKEYFERAAGKFTKDKDYEGAILDFTGCLNLEPNNSSCYYMRGASYYSAGKLTVSLSDINKALELEPTYAPALDLKPKIIKAIAAQTENAGVEKEFDGYFNEYDRLAGSINDANAALHTLYKGYTGVEFPNDLDDLRPLNAAQKTEMCKIVSRISGFEQTREQLESKMREMMQAGKLDQTAELREKKKGSEELFIMSGGDDYTVDSRKHLGCAAPQ